MVFFLIFMPFLLYWNNLSFLSFSIYYINEIFMVFYFCDWRELFTLAFYFLRKHFFHCTFTAFASFGGDYFHSINHKIKLAIYWALVWEVVGVWVRATHRSYLSQRLAHLPKSVLVFYPETIFFTPLGCLGGLHCSQLKLPNLLALLLANVVLALSPVSFSFLPAFWILPSGMV